ncbi:MAG: MFS transporter [Chlamydiales bacterium]|nr:MFS transporter [Chlamydiales bacterium]
MNTERQTQRAFLWTRILGVPFWGLVNLLPIILYKDLHVSPLMITLIIALKPMSALLAPYWSQAIYRRPDLVISNLSWANVLRYLPFLFIPWIDSPWAVTAAFGLYMTLTRGVIPGWMETIKCNLPSAARERLVAYGSTIDYCGTALLPFILGGVLDGYEHSWRWLFPLTAALGLLSTLLFLRMPKPVVTQAISQDPPTSFSSFLLKPWKESWHLIREKAGFAHFQIGFMLSGAGIMLMQPILPMFFVDTLNLSYTKMLLAVTACKAIGFLVTSPFWIKLFRRLDIYYFSGIVTAGAALFPFLLLGSQYHIVLLYAAYGLYGMMQAGSELGWHMSGPRFAEEHDSTVYSGTNVLMVGIRGCIAPPLGALIYSWTNSATVMMLCVVLCLLATRQLLGASATAKAIRAH